MCLSYVDMVTRRRRIGYKLYFPNDSKTVLGTIIARKKYPKRKWIKDHKKLEIITSDGTNYKTGFHYYFKLVDAYLNKSKSSKAEIYKILARKIVCTGKDCGYDVGVAREIFIKEKVEYAIKVPTSEQKYRKLKSLLEVKEISKWIDKIYKNLPKMEITNEKEILNFCENFLKLITRDLKTYCEYVTFLDKFGRYSNRFQIMTKFHAFALKHHSQYMKLYKDVCLEHQWIPAKQLDSIKWNVWDY